MNKITQILLASTSFTALVLGAQNAAHAASLTPNGGSGTITYTQGVNVPVNNGNGVKIDAAANTSVALTGLTINNSETGGLHNALEIDGDGPLTVNASGAGAQLTDEAANNGAALLVLGNGNTTIHLNGISSGVNDFTGVQGIVAEADGGTLAITTGSGDEILANKTGPAIAAFEGSDAVMALGNAFVANGGYTAGIYAGNASTITITSNGDISGDGTGTDNFDTGIAVQASVLSTVTTGSGSSATGGIAGVYGDVGAGALTVNNHGSISGGYGVVQTGEGALTVHNFSTGIIHGEGTGIANTGAHGAGSLNVTNDFGGSILGGDIGIQSVNVGDSITNLGTITSTLDGVTMVGGTLVNGDVTGDTSGAMISGNSDGIEVQGLSGSSTTTITNYAGATIGGFFAIFAVAGDGSQLTIDDYGTLTGTVSVNGTMTSTIDLEAGATAGDIDVLGSRGAGVINIFSSDGSAAEATFGTLTGNAGDKIVLTGGGEGTFDFNSASTFGSVGVASGDWKLTAASSSNTLGLDVEGGTLDLNGNSQTVAWLTGAGGIVINNGAGNATLTVGGGDYSGSIQDGTHTTGLTVDNGGTLTLRGDNTYSGNTLINSESTLVLAGSGSISNSFVEDHGIFDISGTTTGATISGLDGEGLVHLGSRTLTINGGGEAGFVGVIDGSGGLTISNGSSVFLGNSNTYTGDTNINSGGSLRLGEGGTNILASGNNVSVSGEGRLTIGQDTTQTLGTVTLGDGETGGNLTQDFGSSLTASTSITLNNGSLYLNEGSSLSTPSFTQGGGAITVHAGENATSFSADTFVQNGGTITVQTSGEDDATFTSATSFTQNAGKVTVGNNTGEGAAVLNTPSFSQTSTSAHLIVGYEGTANIGSLSGNGTIHFNEGGTVNAGWYEGTSYTSTYSGTLSGEGTFAKEGTGTLTLSGYNHAFSGEIEIDGGTLKTGSTSALGDDSVDVENGTLDLNGFSNDAAHPVALFGEGTSGVITNSSTTAATFAINGGWFHGVIQDGAGQVGLDVEDASTLNLYGVNTYSGFTLIQGEATLALHGGGGISNSLVTANGTFDISDTTAGTSIVGLSGEGLVHLGSKTLTINGGGESSFGGVIDGAGELILLDSSHLILNNANTYTGNTIINSESTLALTEGGSISHSANVDVQGTFDISGTNGGAWILGFNGEGQVHLGSKNLTINGGGESSFDGVIDGAGELILLDSSHLILNNANTYTGNTIINSESTLVLTGSGSIASSGVEDNGTFDISGTTSGTWIAGLSGEGQVVLGSNTLTINGGGESRFNGVISGEGGLTVSNESSVRLSGNNTYTGTTTVNSDGSLWLGNGGTDILASGDNVSVTGEGSLTIGYGTEQTLGTVTLGDGESSGYLTLRYRSSLTANTGITLNNGEVSLHTDSNLTTASFTQNGGTVTVGDGEGRAVLNAASFTQTSANAGLIIGSEGIAHIGSLSGDGTIWIGEGGVVVAGKYAGTSYTSTYSGMLSGENSVFVKAGTGTLTLSGDNSGFDGHFIIAGGGTLQAGSTTALGNNGVLIANGTLDLDGFSNDPTAPLVLVGTANAIVTNSSTTAVVFTTDGGAYNGVIEDGAGQVGLHLVAGGPPLGLFQTSTLSGPVTIDPDAILALASAGTSLPNAPVTDNGTLQLLATGTSEIGALTGSGSVVLHNNTLVVNEASGTFSGVISNGAGPNGGIEIAGGTQILTGTNTYAGATLIDEGATLQLGTGDTSGQLSGSTIVTDNGTLALDHSGTTDITSSIAGTGSLHVMAGTVDIQGAQTTLAGTLTIDHNATADLSLDGWVGSMSVADNGTFDISGITDNSTSIVSLSGNGQVTLGSKELVITDGTGTYSGNISDGGEGGSVAIVSGTETLSGTNSWSGGTFVGTDTTLIVSGPGSLGSGTVEFAPGSTITFLSSGTYSEDADFDIGAPVFNVGATTITWTGQLTGAGDLEVTGNGGTLILTNATNNYAGGTEVVGGSTLQVDQDAELGAVAPLQLGDATTQGTLKLGASFNLDPGRTITLNAGGGGINTNGFNTTISQNITGGGGLTKSGAGTLTLSGANAFTGPSTVNGGILSVTGTTTSGVAVNNGGTLAGTGAVGATSVASGGTISPGVGGIGTLSINGALSLASGSTTAIDLSSSSSDLIAATGAASVNGTLSLTSLSATLATSNQLVLSGSSVSGTFSNIVITGAFSNYTPFVSYGATGVDVRLGLPLPQLATTINGTASATSLAGANVTGVLYQAVAATTASPGVTGAALSQLAGDIHPSLRSAALEDSRVVRDALLDHMDKAVSDDPWITGFGGFGSLGTDGNAASLHHEVGGVLAGADMALDNGLRLGGAVGYTSNSASTTGRLSTASGNLYDIAGYVSWSSGAINLKAAVAYSSGRVHVIRTVPGISAATSDSEDQSTVQEFGDFGYKLDSSVPLEPFVTLAHVEASSGAFTESGGIAALSGGSKSDSDTYSTLGLRATLSDIGPLTPKASIGWQHSFTTLAPGQAVSFQNTGTSFTVLGLPVAPDAAALQLGFDARLSANATVSLDYDGSFASRTQNNAVRGTLDWRF